MYIFVHACIAVTSTFLHLNEKATFVAAFCNAVLHKIGKCLLSHTFVCFRPFLSSSLFGLCIISALHMCVLSRTSLVLCKYVWECVEDGWSKCCWLKREEAVMLLFTCKIQASESNELQHWTGIRQMKCLFSFRAWTMDCLPFTAFTFSWKVLLSIKWY